MRLTPLLALPLALALLFPAAAAAENAGGIAPAPQALVDAFSAVRPDPAPPELNRKSHFVVSDENHHWLFKEYVLDRGGVMIGVGTDQMYTMGAWAKPEVLVLMDFDQVVVDLHKIYRLAILNAADADDLINMWRKDDDRLKGYMAAEWPDAAARKPYDRAFRISRGLVWGRLRKVRRIMKARNTSCWLDDPAQFNWVKGMYQANRVYMMRGDLTAELTVLDLAKAAKAVNLPVRVMYVSNAEAYFRPYPESYKRNMRALPMDDRSMIVRTMGYRPDWSPDALYEYNLQTGENFQAWMTHMTRGSVRHATRGRRKDKKKMVSFAEALPKGYTKPGAEGGDK